MMFAASTAGGRIIISSDGVWDALSAEQAIDCCRDAARCCRCTDCQSMIAVQLTPNDFFIFSC